MRGRPLIQFAMFALLWLALLLPILRVTRASPGSPVAAADEAKAVPVWITLRFSSPPARFEIRQEGRALWRDQAPDGRMFDREVALPMDALGTEFTLAAELPGGESVVEVVIEPDGMRPQARTLWVEGSFEQVVSYDRGGR